MGENNSSCYLSLLIMGLSVVLAATFGSSCGPDVNKIRTIGTADRIYTAIKHFEEVNGKYPDALDDLIKGTNTYINYPDDTKFLDAYGNVYIYSKTNDVFTLTSKGKDGVLGTKDDFVLMSWEVIAAEKLGSGR